MDGQEKLACFYGELWAPLVSKKMSKNEMDEERMDRTVGSYLAMLRMKSHVGFAFTERHAIL